MKNYSRSEIYKKIVEEHKTKRQTCKELSCDLRTLNKYLLKHNIEKPTKIAYDVSGQRFGRLVLISFVGRNKYSKQIWKCECDCGKEKEIDLASLKRGLTTSCGCYKIEKIWKGCGGISRAFWTKLESTSVKRGYEFSITIEDAWDIYLKQDKKCSLSGLPIVFTRTYAHRTSDQTASPDRIDSDYGYIVDNFQWVHKTVNRIKGVLSNAELVTYCKAIYENNKEIADKLNINLVETNGWRKKEWSRKQN